MADSPVVFELTRVICPIYLPYMNIENIENNNADVKKIL
jgi:hypothetical protein